MKILINVVNARNVGGGLQVVPGNLRYGLLSCLYFCKYISFLPQLIIYSELLIFCSQIHIYPY